jgi:hypothetical protein
MKTLMIALAATSALAAAAPASAQYQGQHQNQRSQNQAAASFDVRINQLEQRLEAGIRSGSIDRREAASLRQQLAQLRQFERDNRRHGFNAQQQGAMQQRIAQLRNQIRTADRGSYDRHERQDLWAEYDSRYGAPGSNPNAYGAIAFDARIAQLGQRLEAGIRSGAISRRAAPALRQQLAELDRLERQTRARGLDRRQQNDMQQRIAQLRQQIRTADRGAWDRNERQGDWAEFDGHGGTDWGQTSHGRSQAAECSGRTGLGGIVESLIGGGGNSTCLRVGERVSGNLYGVPQQHAERYRDGGGVYYRSDGRMIYGIDARTHTVVQVYSM